MTNSTPLQQLVDQMPNPDERSMYTRDLDPQTIEQVLAQLFEGGPESLRGLIEMLGEPGTAENVKPHYAAHCLENYALVAKDADARSQFTHVLAEELAVDRPHHVKAFLCQLLGWGGDEQATAALGALLLDEQLVEPATMALVAIGRGAAEQFLSALSRASGKCRLNVVHGLAATAAASSRAALRAALGDADREVRLAAASGLARLVDIESAQRLLEMADAASGWERTQLTKYCLALAEHSAAADILPAARQIYHHLLAARTDPSERHIHEAAANALAAL